MSEFSRLRERAGLSIAEAAVVTGYGERTLFRWEAGATKPRRAALELIRSHVKQAAATSPAAFTFIDLFAGIGGLRRGFEAAGGRCVFTSEWNEYSQKTYRANFPDDDHEIAGDIREVAATSIPAHDLLLAGFPCQPFSLPGCPRRTRSAVSMGSGARHRERCSSI